MQPGDDAVIRPVEEGAGARLNILLVEDDPAHAELIIRSLEDHPLSNKIHHLADGEAALPGKPDGGELPADGHDDRCRHYLHRELSERVEADDVVHQAESEDDQRRGGEPDDLGRCR